MWTNPRYTELTGRPSPDAAPKAPKPTGDVLATFPRKAPDGTEQELRVVLDSFEGHAYLSIRVWERDRTGQWWPLKGKGVSVRMAEASGVAEALVRAATMENPQSTQDDARRPASPMDHPRPPKRQRGR